MKVENVLLEEPQMKPLMPKGHEGAKCIFLKTETCVPTKMKFKICAKCHRCQVVTMENVIPRIFDKIVAVAIFMAGTLGGSMGTPSGAEGASSGNGAGSGAGSGGAGGAGGGGGGGAST